jgi:hypothetical protein
MQTGRSYLAAISKTGKKRSSSSGAPLMLLWICSPFAPRSREGALGLPRRRLRRVHRQGGEEAREALGIFPHQLGLAVIRDARELGRQLRRAELLERRHAERDDLRVVVLLEQVHDAEALIQVVDAGHAPHPRADAGRSTFQLQHPLPERVRKEVAEGVHVTHGVSSGGFGGSRMHGRGEPGQLPGPPAAISAGGGHAIASSSPRR